MAFLRRRQHVDASHVALDFSVHDLVDRLRGSLPDAFAAVESRHAGRLNDYYASDDFQSITRQVLAVRILYGPERDLRALPILIGAGLRRYLPTRAVTDELVLATSRALETGTDSFVAKYGRALFKLMDGRGHDTLTALVDTFRQATRLVQSSAGGLSLEGLARDYLEALRNRTRRIPVPH